MNKNRQNMQPIQTQATVKKTQGLIAAPFTPMHADRTLHLDAIDSYAQWLSKNKVVGAFVCGTTGEGMSLTIQERMHVAERWVQVAPPGLRVIVHVGHATLADCLTLASHAESIGADSTSCLAPFFFKPQGIPGLVEWCEAVASAAPSIPFYFYHIPSMTGVSLQVHEFLQAASERIPNLAGVKYTYEDVQDCEQCVRLQDGRFDVLFGRDEKLLTSLKFGVRGAVGSTYNFAAPIYLDLIDAYERQDEPLAIQLQELAIRMIDTLIQGGSSPIATFKWFMSQVGVDCGPTRLPLVEPTDSQKNALKRRLQEIGILAYLQRKT
ncbi:MAG: dihydrodipicolinate synthase family protein [Pirellula sp.]